MGSTHLQVHEMSKRPEFSHLIRAACYFSQKREAAIWFTREFPSREVEIHCHTVKA